MKPLKINTRCLLCDHEFPDGELVLSNDDLGNSNWGCPSCNSHNIEEILAITHTNEPYIPEKDIKLLCKYEDIDPKFPCKYEDVNPKFGEGSGHD